MIFRFPIFGGFPGRGGLSRMKALLDAHSVALDNVEGEDGIAVRKNWKGGLTISGSAGFQASSSYASFFKVWATAGASIWFGVKDGSGAPLSDDRCGIVRVNGHEVNVYDYSVEIESAGNYYAWVLAWMDDVLGRGAEVIINNGSTPAAPVRATPAPTHIVSHGVLLCGRLSVNSSMEISFGPGQDYLRGGVAEMLLLGPCGNDVTIELT